MQLVISREIKKCHPANILIGLEALTSEEVEALIDIGSQVTCFNERFIKVFKNKLKGFSELPGGIQLRMTSG